MEGSADRGSSGLGRKMGMKYEPGARISEYVLEERLGTGTFGEVWRGRHHVWSDVLVAVKLPTEPEYVRYLQREGVVVHGLKHANIVRVLGLDPYAEPPYLVMELVTGPSLRQVIKEHPLGVTPDTALVVLRGILSAMSAAHAAGVVHRDLKPGNVLLNLPERGLDALQADDVKVSDFGLGVSSADTLRSIAQSVSLAREDELVGTLAYMAPEVRDGTRKPDPRSDLYSVGVILFELLTGERPAGAEFPSTVHPNVQPAWDEIFRRLYARYDRRYESADEVLADLAERLALPRRRAEVAGASSPLGGATTDEHGIIPDLPPVPRAARHCPACRRIVDADDQFCIHCGYQLVPNVRRCPSCQAYPATNEQFCVLCGAALTAPEEAGR